MNPQFWWYLTRSSGLVAWALLTASTIWGLLLSSRLVQGRPRPKWLLDLHRHLGGLSVTFTGLHLITLMADSYVEFNITDIAVPFVSSWKPLPVALGIIALYFLVAIEVSSLAMKHLSRAKWRLIHLTSYAAFWLATVHGIAAGTDVPNLAYWAANTLATTFVVFLTIYRLLAERTSRPVRQRLQVQAQPPSPLASPRS